jgi:fatty-acyl-CoA synthase
MLHKRVCDIWYSSAAVTGLSYNDNFYVTLPLYHTSGNVIGTSVFTNGGTMVLRRKFSASAFMDDMRKYFYFKKKV